MCCSYYRIWFVLLQQQAFLLLEFFITLLFGICTFLWIFFGKCQGEIVAQLARFDCCWSLFYCTSGFHLFHVSFVYNSFLLHDLKHAPYLFYVVLCFQFLLNEMFDLIWCLWILWSVIPVNIQQFCKLIFVLLLSCHKNELLKLHTTTCIVVK